MKILHGGDVWQAGAPEDFLDFSANLNPEGPPEWVRAAMLEGLARAPYYPDVRSQAALRGMSAHLHLPEAAVLLTSGGIEAAALAAAMPGENVVFQPTFQEYGHLCGEYRCVRRENALSMPVSAGMKLWLCNPNNPTGHAFSRVEMLALLDRTEAAGAWLIVDEAFIDYCPEHSICDCVVAHPRLIVLGSLTKILAIPGVRLGYLAAHPQVVAQLGADLPPWRLNCVADAVAAALPGRDADFGDIRRLNRRRRERFAAALAALGARVHPSEANFLLCDFGRDMRPEILRLQADRVLVRPCGMFPGLTHGHVRLCVRRDEENDRLIGLLRPMVGKR